jgi:hypothetical protein
VAPLRFIIRGFPKEAAGKAWIEVVGDKDGDGVGGKNLSFPVLLKWFDPSLVNMSTDLIRRRQNAWINRQYQVMKIIRPQIVMSNIDKMATEYEWGSYKTTIQIKA